MANQHEREEGKAPSGIPLTGIYFDFQTQTVFLAAREQIVAQFALRPQGIIFDTSIQPIPQQEPATPVLPLDAGTPSQPAQAETEKSKAVTLQGKLKSKPREGRPDSRGNLTAWARFAAHEEAQDGAHLYSATFHKHTAKVALSLDKDAPLTVQGYPHEHDDPGSNRMDTLSVINLLAYPGKPPGKNE